MVERGPGPDTLDTALLRQATGLGVEVRFNSRLPADHDHSDGAHQNTPSEPGAEHGHSDGGHGH